MHIVVTVEQNNGNICFIHFMVCIILTKTFFFEIKFKKYAKGKILQSINPRKATRKHILRLCDLDVCILSNLLTIFSSRLSLVTGQVIDPFR